MHLLLLVACAGPHDAAPDDPARDTADTAADTADTADTAAPDDTDTATETDTADTDTAETDTPDPDGPHTWDASFFGGADLTIAACGTADDGVYVLAPGPDLDGDGLPELAVGAPYAESAVRDQGVVYLLRGADLAGGTASVFDAWARASGPRGARSEGFGQALQWVGDRDGDGVDDLLVGAARGSFREDVSWVVSGAALAAGGELTAAGAEIEEELGVTVRWDDLDGDGTDDWIFGSPYRGMGTGYGYRGALGAVYDDAFDLSGAPVRAREVYGQDAEAHAGRVVAVLDADYDGDGVREVATSLGADTVVVNSGALLAWATYVDELVRWRFTGMEATEASALLALGDVDGGGRDDLLFLYPGGSMCIGRGEDADATGGATTCFEDPDLDVPVSVARGGDLDGDGIADVWGRTADALVAWDVAALVDGRVVERARIAVAGSSASNVVAADGALWTDLPVFGRHEVATAWSFPEADGLTTADASVTITGGGWGGSPEEDPAWIDLTGDGVDDLVLFDHGTLDLFDGTGLAAGGARTYCDADLHVEWSGIEAVTWLDDLDGDSAVDALLTVTDATTVGVDHRVVSGRVLAGLATGADLAAWSGDRLFHVPGCDLTDDGRDEVFINVDDREDTVRAYDGAAVLAGALAEDPDGALLGSIRRDDSHVWCVPDVDGDGGDELVVNGDGDHQLFLSTQLDPATTLDPDAAWVTFPEAPGDTWDFPFPLGDLDGDGADDHAWYIEKEGSTWLYEMCVLDPAALVLGGELAVADAPLRCVAPFATYQAVAVDHAVGGPEADLLVLAADTEWTWSFVAYDGATLAGPTVLARLFSSEEDDDYTGWSGGLGPDVLGTGARSLWTRWQRRDVGYWTVEVLYARTP